MKVVVVCVQCFRSQAGLCWRVHGYSTQLHWQHSLQGIRQKWTDLSHHAQLSMCTSRDKMAASGMEFSVLKVWICCCRLMKSWLIMFILHIICTRPIGRLVSQFYSSLGCFYPSGTTGRVVSSNTDNYRPRKFHRTLNGENPSCGYRDMVSASLAAARPDRDDNTPPAQRAEGWKENVKVMVKVKSEA